MKINLFPLLLLFLLGACQVKPLTVEDAPTQPILLPSSSPTSNPTLTPTATATLQPTITPHPSFNVCSPLEDETFQSLLLILANPLIIPPSFGMDTGHHGVDFAYYQRGDRISIEGIEIYAILPGEVVFTLENNIPYGYALLLETPLDELPHLLQERLLSGYQPVPDDPHYRLYCPEVEAPIISGNYSIYHLYAHMQAKPKFNHAEKIKCGQTLGTVGSTGYSSSPHLHLETRIGPSGANFRTMAHYENTNTIDQMKSYCLWRMSGYYQLFDPFILFDTTEAESP